jgi:hypothetical protein
MALLQVQSDLHRLLLQRPESAAERRAWRAGVSVALIEAARGRLYLSRLESSDTGSKDVSEIDEQDCSSQERQAS